jgi:hypothetical protein
MVEMAEAAEGAAVNSCLKITSSQKKSFKKRKQNYWSVSGRMERVH